MWGLIWRCLTIILVFGYAVAVPTSLRFTSNASMPASLVDRQNSEDPDEFNESDLSFITTLAAIGDSYSAGIGAGDRLGSFIDALDPTSDYACSRYDHAYPYLVNFDPRLGDPSTRTFQFLSCSGSVTSDVLETQIPALNSNQQVILLSVGGNDVELVKILNQCIFQWAVLNSEQIAVAQAAAVAEALDWALNYDFSALGLGCAGQLARTQSLIASDTFISSLDSVLNAAKVKLAPGGMIYYMGYAKFFDEALTADCDNVSWSMWIYKLVNIFQAEAFLTTSNRQIMNDLVDAMNAQLSAAVERAGPSVMFVNYDSYVGQFGGRYCNAGINEAIVDSRTRTGLMFYEMNSWDPAGSTPWKRSSQGPLSGTFDGSVNVFAQITLLMDPNAEFVDQSDIIPDTTSNIKPEKLISELETSVFQVPNLVPDGYGRVFHPQILLHELIANLVIYEMTNLNEQINGFPAIPQDLSITSCPFFPLVTLENTNVSPGQAVKPGTELRILCVGDSITVGFRSDMDGGDGNGYRLEFFNDLSKDNVIFAGTEISDGTMPNGYYAAWSGQTIQYIADNVGPSLLQRPNIILVHAGTNDMNPNPAISIQGNSPAGAASRLGALIDQMVTACPDATILVAMIISTCDPTQEPQTQQFQALIPGVVAERARAGKQVLAVDFTTFPTSLLHQDDCIHPTNAGYSVFGDYWYDFVTQIPSAWINKPVGADPDRTDGVSANGGLDMDIPPPDWGISPVQITSFEVISAAFYSVEITEDSDCAGSPYWIAAGEIAIGGVGHNGAWQYEKNWVSAGEVATGLFLDPTYVSLHDMNGDGKADYIWLDPITGEITCWLNNLPDPWAPAGTNNGIIGSGAGQADSVFIADMNGDGLEDYMVVNPDTGAVDIWWNYGADDDWVNGWKFVEGGQIASGVPHANWKTLRFPDINGDGRADYVVVGEGGALLHYMNTGTAGGQDVLFLAQGGIATGAVSDIATLVFADMDGDGRDDYLIWDDIGGLTGFLNQRTQVEGVPLYINQGPGGTIAGGITQSPSSIRLADLDGDGKDDYAYIDQNGAIWLWYNRGSADTTMNMDGIRFADIDGDGKDDYVWLDPVTGAPTVYLNNGLDQNDILGWAWAPLNNAQPIASGAAPASQVKFGDIDGDGMDDYLVLDPETGALTVYLNAGADASFVNGWRFNPIGSIATGLGPGKNVRFADIDGDGRDDYIYLHPNGGTTIYRNVYNPDTPLTDWSPFPEADASGIGQRPEEIDFVDINDDGKADYVWTSVIDGSVNVWLNNYPNQPTWLAQGKLAGGVGTSGACVMWARLQEEVGASYIAVNPNTGAIAAWLNVCSTGETG